MTRPHEQADGDGMAELRAHTQRLASELPGSLRRLSVRSGEAVVEVEWQDSAGAGEAAAVVADARSDDQPAALHPAEDPGESVVISSPMVGTVYLAPSPEKPPYVRVGDIVEQGQTVAIVEAMKLFNPIVADSSGVVREVLVNDAQPVEFDQPLLRMKVSADAESTSE